jgi:hypothetical protein
MAKKAIHKGAHKAVPHKRFLLRVPIEIADWVDETAIALGMTRDSFMRLQMKSIRDGFRLSEAHEAGNSELFRNLESKLMQSTERAVRQAVDGVLRATIAERIPSSGAKGKSHA